MTRNLYALLVGIDHYRDPVPPLKGCVNDVLAIAAYLQQRVAQQDYQLHLEILTEEQATRAAIINRFQTFLTQAESQDIALFYYSGHGSQEESPPEFWAVEPDHLDETLVCWDSRTETGWDLADKELAHLIAQVSQKNPDQVIILDCCHSAGVTRNPERDLSVRWVQPDQRQRPLDSFIVSPSEVVAFVPSRSLQPLSASTQPHGNYILFAACRDNEQAREYYANQQYHGIFSYFLLETLKRANRDLTYRDIFKRTDVRVRTQVSNQSPQLEATSSNTLDHPFLGGAIADCQSYFTVSADQTWSWVIDGGAVHGIPTPTPTETTQLAIFPVNTTVESIHQTSQIIAEAEVIAVQPHLSQIHLIQQNIPLDPTLTYKAVVTRWPLPPLGVYFSGEETGITLVRQALNSVSLMYLRETTAESATFSVWADHQRYHITFLNDGRSAIAPLVGYSQNTATQALQSLEHIARWMMIATLSHPSSSRIPANAVQLQIYQGETEIKTAQIQLCYAEHQGTWQQPRCRVKLTNHFSEPLYCVLLDLTDRYQISANLLPGGGVWLEPQQQAWALGGQPIYASIPQEKLQQGIGKSKDILKVIVSTAQFDATLLEQEKLEQLRTRSVQTTPTEKTNQIHHPLNRLMRHPQTRDLGGSEVVREDWMTSEITLTTLHPQLLEAKQTKESVPLNIPNRPSFKQATETEPTPSPNSHPTQNLVKGIILLLSTAVLLLSLLVFHLLRDEAESSCNPSREKCLETSSFQGRES